MFACRLDESPASPYLRLAMTRLVLTLLALLTGLAAQLSPAQAAVGVGREVEIGTLRDTQEVGLLAARIAARVVPIASHARAIEAPRPAPAYAAPAVATVLQGIDRARE